MSEFSDRPFVAGSLFGLRAFAVDSLGRLAGPTYGGIFKPDVNEAACLVDPYTTAMQAQLVSLEARMRGLADIENSRRGKRRRLSESAVQQPEASRPKHTLGGLGCKCGFYAYYDGMNDYLQTGRVGAIVEGFGVCTVGTRGFRSSKARLVALIEPPMGRAENYYPAFAMTFGARTAGTLKGSESMSPLLWSYVQRNYPDVPVFASQDDALAEHPLYQPEVPTPETAEDFWIRSAS